jgi:uncharacterized protein with HEPN domain
VSKDKLYLIYILECISNIEELVAGGRTAFEAAKHNRAAMLYYLQTMAEATQRLSESLKTTHPEVDWVAISGFRNRLAHSYLDVNMNIVWTIIEQYLPDLKSAVIGMLQKLGDE